MEARTSKPRSTVAEQKPSTQSTTKRPVAIRHKSETGVSAVASRRKSDAKRLSEQTKASSTNKYERSSSEKTSPLPATTSKSSSGTVDRHRGSSQKAVGGAKASEHDSLPLITFAVLGAPNSGRTTFVRQALELRKPCTGPLSSSKVSLSGSIYRIQLLELSTDDVDIGNYADAIWPDHIDDTPTPTINGAFCLYDVTNEDSVTGILSLASLFSNCQLPCMVIACKTDVPHEDRSFSTRLQQQISRTVPSTHCAEVSFNSAESQKICLLGMLRRVLAIIPPQSLPKTPADNACDVSESLQKPLAQERSSRRDQETDVSKSRRATSRHDTAKANDVKVALQTDVRKESSKHVGSSGEDKAHKSKSNRPLKSSLRVDTANAREKQVKDTTSPQRPKEALINRIISPSDTSHSAVLETSDSIHQNVTLKSAIKDIHESSTFKTFFHAEEDSHDELSQPRRQDASPKPETLTTQGISHHEEGVGFPTLVRRVLSLPTSKVDSDFLDRFLCLYRAFASPRQLFLGIVDEWVKVERGPMGQFAKVAELLRFLQVLSKWTATYPGDFCGTPVRTIVMAFVHEIEKSKNFGPAAREISNNLEAHVTDDDLDWAYDETTSTATSSGRGLGTTGSGASLPTSPVDTRKSAQEDHLNESDDEDHHETDSSTRNSRTGSTASSLIRTANTSSQSFTGLLSFDNARYHASRFRLRPHTRLSKLQWHLFMDTPLDDLAKEITRIDWTMYSTIRPRDFVRHVCLSAEQKRRSKQNDSIHTMVKHFNHLALFVSGMILLRDKPKHRAKALEKFMALAWKIRQLNNYNSLGAIVAGISGHEISRLNWTKELVPPETQKEFLRLVILMGISRSHAAYRMAWENSFQERIPFLPLLRQDLTMAAAANPTFIGSNVNWKKFEIMGDVIIGVQRSLEQPYTFPAPTLRSDEIIRLILETKIVEDSEDSADPRCELHDRSVQVEPSSTVPVDPRRRFDWLRR